MGLPVARSRRSSARPAKSLAELQDQLGVLEGRAEEIGARSPDAPGSGVFQRVFRSPVVRTTVDLLSRPNYAAAGFAEELFGNASLSGAVSRTLREIFSGFGGIQGDKESFGQVLEQAGWGTATLSDLVPVLEGTWVGNFGSRGAAGLALDIATDPLTYVTFGASTGAKAGFKSGTKYLSKEGMLDLAKIREGVRKGFKQQYADAAASLDDARLLGIERAIDDEAGELFLKKWTTQDGSLPSRIADPGGVKFLGRSVIPTSTFRQLHGKTIDLITSIPGGQRVLEDTQAFSRGLGDATASVFSPFAALRPLKFKQPAMYERALDLHRDTAHLRTKIQSRYQSVVKHGNEALGIAPDMRGRWGAELKKDELLGNKLYSVRYGVPDPLTNKKYTVQDLTPEQLVLFQEYNALAKWSRETLVGHGIFKADELSEVYYPARYENIDELGQVHALNPRALDGSRISSSFLKERIFDNPWEAVQTTRKSRELSQSATLSRRQAGLDPPAIRPELVPNYNLMENFDGYFSKYADALARQSWQDRIVSEFGVPLSEVLKSGDIWHHETWTGSYFGLKPAEIQAITDFFKPADRKVAPVRVGWKELLREESRRLKVRGRRKDIESSLMIRAEKTLEQLSPAGQRSFMQRLLSSVSSEAQATTIDLRLGEKFADAFPTRLHSADEAASASYEKLYGEGAKHTVVRSSTLTGGKPYLIPEFMVDDLTRIDRDFLLSPKTKELHKIVRAYDKVNSIARLGVYALWLPSALRDAYNNLSLGMFDIGVSMLNPRKIARSVEFLAGRNGVIRTAAGAEYTYKELDEIGRTLGVIVPGRVFAEGVAGKGGKLAAFADKRGAVENAARVQLWLANIERGIAPRQAARHVTEFLFDYGEVSPFFRSFMKRAFFFPTFTMKNVPFWTRELRRNPGMAINQLKPFRGRHEDNKEMVSWQADQLRIRLDQDGKTVHFLTGIDLPITNLDTLWGGGLGKSGRRFLSMLAPVPRTMQEQVSGTNLLTGRPLSRTQSQSIGRIIDTVPTPRALKDWLGYAKDVDQAGRPTYTFDEQAFALLVRSWAFSRVVSSSDRVFRSVLESDTPTLQALFDSSVTGIRYNSVDMSKAKEQMIRARIQALREAISKRGFRSTKPGRELE